MRHRRNAIPFAALVLIAARLPLVLQPQNPPQPDRAGKIVALVPVNHVVRQQTQLEATKEMPLFWRDLITTQRAGRVRARLDDGSVLNVGAGSSLLVLRHDAQMRVSELDLIIGRLRARVSRILNPAGKFQIRTPVAAVGVVGTDLYVETTAATTTVIALGGGEVAAQALGFPEVVLLKPGELLTLRAGERPGAKRKATVEELVVALESTLVDLQDELVAAAAIRGKGLVALGEGVPIEATLKKTLDARKVKLGDRIEAKSSRAVKVDGVVVLAKNARLIGRVTKTETRSSGAAESSLGFVFERAVLRDGREVPLRMAVQAIASPETGLASAFDDDWPPAHGGTAPQAASSSGGLLGGVGSTVGTATRTVDRTVDGVAGAASPTAGQATRTTDVATGAATGSVLTPSSTGVFGLPGLTLHTPASTGSNGAIVTSKEKSVRLNGGTRLLLRVAGP